MPTLVVALSLVEMSAPVTATTWESYQVGRIQMPDAYRNCIFFQLVGVAEADPSVPGNPWIAVPATENGYSQIVAFLLWARATQTPIGVVTSGVPSTGGCSSASAIVGISNIYAP